MYFGDQTLYLYFVALMCSLTVDHGIVLVVLLLLTSVIYNYSAVEIIYFYYFSVFMLFEHWLPYQAVLGAVIALVG